MSQLMEPSGSDYARLPKDVFVCETCGTGQGFIWPIASDSMDDHYYIERCDNCDRFESDEEAADFVAAKLSSLGFKFNRSEVFKDGKPASFPYIENIEEE